MSRYMEAITLLIELRARLRPDDHRIFIEKIQRVLDMYESPGEVAIREGDEMIEEALRMNF